MPSDSDLGLYTTHLLPPWQAGGRGTGTGMGTARDLALWSRSPREADGARAFPQQALPSSKSGVETRGVDEQQGALGRGRGRGDTACSGRASCRAPGPRGLRHLGRRSEPSQPYLAPWKPFTAGETTRGGCRRASR